MVTKYKVCFQEGKTWIQSLRVSFVKCFVRGSLSQQQNRWVILQLKRSLSWIMWASAFLSMTEAQLAVYPAGSQVMRRGDKAPHSAHKTHSALGKCVGPFNTGGIIYISKEVVKTFATNKKPSASTRHILDHL